MTRLHFETRASQQGFQRLEGEVVQVPGRIQVEPRRPGPAGLGTRKIGNRHHEPTPGPQDAVGLGEGAPGIRNVLEHVPDHHLVEKRRRVARLGQTRRDAYFRPRIDALGRLHPDLDAVGLETTIGQRTQDHPAATTDVQHARPGRQAAGEERHLAAGSEPDEHLDEAVELRPQLPVVLRRVAAEHRVGIQRRLVATRPAPRADDNGGGHALHPEPGACLAAPAHRTRRPARGSLRFDLVDQPRVKIGRKRQGTSVAVTGREACDAARVASSAGRGR